jgi:hypothetical protein
LLVGFDAGFDTDFDADCFLAAFFSACAGEAAAFLGAGRLATVFAAAIICSEAAARATAALIEVIQKTGKSPTEPLLPVTVTLSPSSNPLFLTNAVPALIGSPALHRASRTPFSLKTLLLKLSWPVIPIPFLVGPPQIEQNFCGAEDSPHFAHSANATCISVRVSSPPIGHGPGGDTLTRPWVSHQETDI